MQVLTVDEVYDIVGHFGLSQIIYFISLSVIQIFISQHMLLNIFAGLQPSFICHFEDKKFGAGIQNYTDKCFQGLVSRCKLEFKGPHSSIPSEWELVCNKKYKVALVQSIFMGGVMFGAFLSRVADRIGRRKTLMFSIMGTIIFEGFAAFAPSYFSLVTFRFLAGMNCSVVILSGFVLSQELIGTKWRSFCAVSGTVFFSFGIAILSTLAANIQGWRILTLSTSVMGIAYLSIPFFVPESPRWLLGNGRELEAKKVLEKIAEGNGTLQLLPTHWSLSIGSSVNSPKSRGVLDLVSHPYILKLTLIQIYSWFVNSAVYYALTMASSSLKGNVYWATTYNGLVEIPAYISSIFIIERYGRIFTICFFMIIGGIVCLAIPFAPIYLTNALALTGKLGISASFAVIYLHSGEIYPTMIRNTALGVLSVAARIGGIISPFLLMMADVQANSQFFVLGAMSLLAGFFNTQLPETLGRPMPDSISDIIALKHETAMLKKSSHRSDGYKKLNQDVEDEASPETPAV